MAEVYPLEITERDLRILRDLFESRVMTTHHIAEIHFEGRKEAALKRLQHLKRAELLAERPRKPFEAAVLLLTQKGLALLAERGSLKDYALTTIAQMSKRGAVSKFTLEHELACIDLKAAFTKAFRNFGSFKLLEFSTWPALYSFKIKSRNSRGRMVLVKPDGFIRISEKQRDSGPPENYFFLELDRSTESQGVLVAKALAYREHYESGGFAKRLGRGASDFKKYPFRVLLVCQTWPRVHQAAQKLLTANPPILRQVLLTTFEEVCSDPNGKIWVSPRDFRQWQKHTEGSEPVKQRILGFET